MCTLLEQYDSVFRYWRNVLDVIQVKLCLLHKSILILQFVKTNGTCVCDNPMFCHETLDGAVWSDIMTSLFTWCCWLVSFHISSQWACLTFKYLTGACCSSVLQKPSISPSSTCIDLLRGDFMWYIWGLFPIYFVQQQSFLHAHSSMSVDVFLVSVVSSYCHYCAKLSESCHDRNALTVEAHGVSEWILKHIYNIS